MITTSNRVIIRNRAGSHLEISYVCKMVMDGWCGILYYHWYYYLKHSRHTKNDSQNYWPAFEHPLVQLEQQMRESSAQSDFFNEVHVCSHQVMEKKESSKCYRLFYRERDRMMDGVRGGRLSSHNEFL